MLEARHLHIARVASDGFAVIEGLLSPDQVSHLGRAVEGIAVGVNARQRGSATYAVRNLFDAAPATRNITMLPAVAELVASILGDGAFVTRAILFDKNPDANWAVPWHQDTTIAVKNRPSFEPAGFGPWSVKAGVHHVQPPVAVLDGMLTLRLHLDDCGEDNAPLRVIPGSHCGGVLEGLSLQVARTANAPITCTVKAGSALLMKPLILHASSPATRPGHRRVIHLEWASASLPHGMEWNRA